MNMMGYGMSHTGGGFGILMMLALFGVLTAIVVALVRSGARRQIDDRTATPLDIAGKRLAAGEITKDEFEELGRTLTRG